MKICLDISCVTSQRTGVGHVAFETAKKLVLNEEYEFVLFFNSLRQPFPEAEEFLRPNVTKIRHRIPGPFLLYAWKYLDMPKIETLIPNDVDCFLSFSGYVPPSKKTKLLALVCDLDFIEGDASSQSLLGGRYLRWVAENRFPQLSGAISISNRTKRQMEKVGFSKPVFVAPMGVDDSFKHVPDSDQMTTVRERYQLPERFVLFVGNRNERKNLNLLFGSFIKFCDKTSEDVSLVMIGPDTHWPNDKVAFKANRLKSIGRLIELPYVLRHDLPIIYNLAGVYLATSVSEGFGLPIIEALAAGTPVACTETFAALEHIQNQTSITTFHTGAKPEDVATLICEAWGKKEDAILRRNDVIQTYDWANTAQSVVKAIESVVMCVLLVLAISCLFGTPQVAFAEETLSMTAKQSRIHSVIYPFAVGKSYRCMQGPNGEFSHSDIWNRYAYDFDMNVGEFVCAVADGTVVLVEQTHTEGGLDKSLSSKANRVIVDHGNNVFSKYLHLAPKSVFVHTGDTVRAGQIIAGSGNTGYSSAPHLHFQMQNMIGKSLPVQFMNVKENKLRTPKRGNLCHATSLTLRQPKKTSASQFPIDLFAASGVSLSGKKQPTLFDFFEHIDITISGKICYQQSKYPTVTAVFCDSETQKVLAETSTSVEQDGTFKLSISKSLLEMLKTKTSVCLFGIAPVDKNNKFLCRETLKIEL